MSDISTNYTLDIEVLSPLHIGNGVTLRKGFDYITQNNVTYRLNDQAILDDRWPENEADQRKMLAGQLTDLIDGVDMSRHPEYSLYHYRGEPTLGEIREHIRDVYGRPYVPGSSLKGNIRTGLLWGMYTATKSIPDLSRLGRGRSWAGQVYEREHFGSEPNLDFLRALHLGDGKITSDTNQTSLENVRIFPTRSQYRNSDGLDIAVETIPRGTRVAAGMHIDEYGFVNAAASKSLGWDGKKKWLNNLVRIMLAWADKRIVDEVDYFRTHAGEHHALKFYEELLIRRQQVKNNEYFMQLGWGAGWDSKTLGNLLRSDQGKFDELIKAHGLSMGNKHLPGDTFPKSRHLVLRGSIPSIPMGWIHIRVV